MSKLSISILFTILSLALIAIGFVIYYIWTDNTPIDFWKAIDGTPSGIIIKTMGGIIIAIFMLILPAHLLKK